MINLALLIHLFVFLKLFQSNLLSGKMTKSKQFCRTKETLSVKSECPTDFMVSVTKIYETEPLKMTV